LIISPGIIYALQGLLPIPRSRSLIQSYPNAGIHFKVTGPIEQPLPRDKIAVGSKVLDPVQDTQTDTGWRRLRMQHFGPVSGGPENCSAQITATLGVADGHRLKLSKCCRLKLLKYLVSTSNTVGINKTELPEQ
jgi:hypothetical protein